MLRCTKHLCQADVDKDVLMVLSRELAEMMVQIAPEIYRKHVTLD
jgi:hypothetical protein